MEYFSKSYRLDEDVIAWLDGLKELHGSVNKGLRRVAFPNGADEAAREKGKASVQTWRAKRKPLPKPKDQKK